MDTAHASLTAAIKKTNAGQIEDIVEETRRFGDELGTPGKPKWG